MPCRVKERFREDKANQSLRGWVAWGLVLTRHYHNGLSARVCVSRWKEAVRLTEENFVGDSST